MNTTTIRTRTSRSNTGARPTVPSMSTSEFLVYLSTHPATARLGRRLGSLLEEATP